MKSFLIVTAFAEGLTGLGLIIAPSFIVSLLLGTPFTDKGGIIVVMIGGSAILSLAFACWLLRNSTNNAGIIKPMLLYNVAVAGIVAFGVINFQLLSPFLYLVLFAHIILAVWSILVLQKKV